MDKNMDDMFECVRSLDPRDEAADTRRLSLSALLVHVQRVVPKCAPCSDCVAVIACVMETPRPTNSCWLGDTCARLLSDPRQPRRAMCPRGGTDDFEMELIMSTRAVNLATFDAGQSKCDHTGLEGGQWDVVRTAPGTPAGFC